MDNIIVIATSCPICGAEHFVKVPEEAYEAWQNGALIQNAFPFLSAEEREWLISGICSECFDRMFH
jgi:hypothetical protein